MATSAIFLAFALRLAQVSQPIEGPPDAPAGKLVVLRATVPNAVSYKWIVANPPADDNHQECEDRLMFATGQAGEYTFFLSALTRDEAGETDHVVAKHTVKVSGGALPGPAPQPTPPGTPAPPQPQPPAGNNFRAVARIAVNNVTADRDKKTTAKFLASLYRGVAKNGAGLQAVAEFEAMTDTMAGAALGLQQKYEAWKPWFDRIDETVTAARMTTVAQYVEAWKEIAAGLEEAAR